MEEGIIFNLITCEDEKYYIKLKIYKSNWYHTYLLNIVIEIMEAMVHQYLYWRGLIQAIKIEVSNCKTCQSTKWQNIKYGKFPDKLSEEVTWNKLCLYIIVPYKRCSK